MNAPRVLVIDDEPDMLAVFRNILGKDEVGGTRARVETETDPRRATERLAAEDFDILFVDLKMPGMDGLDLIRVARECNPALEIVLMTGYPTIESAVEAIKLGASDYITKPFTADQLKLLYLRAAERRRLLDENRFLRGQVSKEGESEPFLGASLAVRQLLGLADRFAESDSNILIVGDTGSGKTLLADRIHRRSLRREKLFIHVDCGALPETLLESELFGHEKGSFTGAVATRRGLLEFAGGGTFFLDDVCVLPTSLQSKLLGVLQERRFRRVGGNEVLEVNVRFIASSNRSPEEEVKAGRLREDFFFRLNVLRLNIPPLRARPDDIPLLAHAFLEKFGRRRGVRALDSEALAALRSYDWPGNVRELRNVIERACTLAIGAELGLEELPEEISSWAGARGSGGGEFVSMRDEVLGRFEADYFRKLMETSKGNVSEAAQRAGLSRNTVYRYLRKYAIQSDAPE